jgi:hypothetical protein
VVVVAPVAEELFFRGLLLRGYLARYSVTTAVWVSALLFALFHLNPWQAIVALPLGVAYAWLVLHTGSVLPSMLSHAMVNFSTNFLLQPLAFVLGYSAASGSNAFPALDAGHGRCIHDRRLLHRLAPDWKRDGRRYCDRDGRLCCSA